MPEAQNSSTHKARHAMTILSNRLPVSLGWDAPDSSWEIHPSSGGLVRALDPLLERGRSVWIGWPGIATDEAERPPPPDDRLSESVGYELETIALTRAEIDAYYGGFANEILWPLCHGLVGTCEFDPSYWEAYQAINERFAEAAARRDGVTWVHDYHLMLVAHRMRARGATGPIGFFLHIPFPTPAELTTLPWYCELVEALLVHDSLGFQARRDVERFLQSLEYCDFEDLEDVEVERLGQGWARVHTSTRTVEVGAHPIGIDPEQFERASLSAPSQTFGDSIQEGIQEPQLILGVDRLDYSKGIPHRLEAYETMLEEHPELHGKVRLLQQVVPSRESVDAYEELKGELEGLISRINGRFGTPVWQPISYMYHTVPFEELVAMYRQADVGLVTPLRDGMNLVSKEYCICQDDGDPGVLVLSKFAGAAEQLGDDALLVNPFDRRGLAEALYRALTMERDERVELMGRLKACVRQEDIFAWARGFLGRLASAGEDPEQRRPGRLEGGADPITIAPSC